MQTMWNKIDDFVNFLNKYGHNDYISPVIMEDIITDKLNLSMIEIVEFVKNAKIVVTVEQIKEHLDKTFELEHSDLKKKLESKVDEVYSIWVRKSLKIYLKMNFMLEYEH